MALEMSTIVLLGVIVGSFLSVCIYRVPIQFGFDQLDDETDPESESSERDIVKSPKEASSLSIGNPPRSFCPTCKSQLKWYHNIPVVSWLLLGGKCSFCKAPISVRYPSVELLSALLASLSVMQFGFTWTALLIYLFCAALLVISFIDYDFYIIPDVISLPGTVMGFIVAGVNQWFHIFSEPISEGLPSSIYGVLAGAGSLYLIAEVYFRLRKREGLGMGDVKLLAMTGAFFGPQCAFYTIFIGSFLGSILGIILILFGGKKLSQEIPFGPYLALGTILYLFTGDTLVKFFLVAISGEPSI